MTTLPSEEVLPAEAVSFLCLGCMTRRSLLVPPDSVTAECPACGYISRLGRQRRNGGPSPSPVVLTTASAAAKRPWPRRHWMLGIGVVVVIVMSGLVWRMFGYGSPKYWAGLDALAAGHQQEAAELFTQAAREGDEQGIAALTQMNDIVALEKLISLMDLPGNGKKDAMMRVQIIEAVDDRTRIREAEQTALPYEPFGPPELRQRQQMSWSAWLTQARDHYSWANGSFRPK